MPRTMSAEREAEIRDCVDEKYDDDLVELLAELDAERAVSKALADALKHHFFNEKMEFVGCSCDSCCLVRAALAQYAALEPPVLASSEDLPADASPSQGGRD